jgi:hypothetical protein
MSKPAEEALRKEISRRATTLAHMITLLQLKNITLTAGESVGSFRAKA